MKLPLTINKNWLRALSFISFAFFFFICPKVSLAATPDPTITNLQTANQVVQAVANPAAAVATAAVTQAASAATSNKTAAPPGECNLWNWGSWGDCVAGALATVAAGMASLAGFLLGFVGAFFNWIVVITVFKFGSYFGNSAGLLAAWGILRDIGNIALLFGFILMGVLMILDLHSVDTRKAIPQLIIVAVLLNFSLFATEAVIDVSNVLSAALYNQAGGAVACNVNQTTADCANATNQGIAGQILNAAGLNGVFSQVNGNKGNGGSSTSFPDLGKDNIHKLIVYIGLTVFMSVAMVVLLAASIMLVIRGITLTIVMVLSPLGFAAMVLPLPAIKSLGDRWQKALFSQAFFAPVYLLLVLVSLKIMEAVQTSLNPAGSNKLPGTLLDSLSQSNTSLTGVVIVFALVIGFMIAALMTAKGMGAAGADFATSVARKSVQGTMTAPLRLGAYGARAAGAFGYRKIVSPTADGAINKYNQMIGAARNKKGVTGALAKIFDNNVGAGITNTLTGVRELKVAGAPSYSEKKKSDAERERVTMGAAEKAHLTDTAKKGLAAQQPGESDQDFKDRRSKAEGALQKMEQKDIEDLLTKTGNKESRTTLVRMLSADRFEKVMENHDLSQLHDKLVEERYAEIEDLYGAWKAVPDQDNFDKLRDVGKKFTPKELKLLGKYNRTTLSNLMSVRSDTGTVVFKDEAIDSVIKDGSSFTASQIEEAEATKKPAQLKAIVLNPSPTMSAADRATKIQNLMKKMGKNAGKLERDVLLSQDIAPGLKHQHFTSIVSAQDDSNLESVAERRGFLENIARAHASNSIDATEYKAIYDSFINNRAARLFFAGINTNILPQPPQP